MRFPIVKLKDRIHDRSAIYFQRQLGRAPFPVPGHRTGRADLPHPALRQVLR